MHTSVCVCVCRYYIYMSVQDANLPIKIIIFTLNAFYMRRLSCKVFVYKAKKVIGYNDPLFFTILTSA